MTCKLIGVVRRRHGHGKGMRRGYGLFSEFRERWQEHKEDDAELEGRKWTRWDYDHHQGHQHMGGMRMLRRLLDLGITKGCTFLVVQGNKAGPVLVQVRGTRVALGQGLASRMLVQVVDNQ